MKNCKALTLLTLMGLLASCGTVSSSSSSSKGGNSSNSGGTTSGNSSSSSSTYNYSSFDVDSSFSKAETDETYDEKITLDGESATFEIGNENVTLVDGDVTISASGTYLIESASLYTKHINVTASDGTVELLLNGVGISVSEDGFSPIYAPNGCKLTVKKIKGSLNYIFDGRDYTNEDLAGNAAIFCKKKLNVTGKGSLTVIGNYNNGIGSKVGVTCKNGTLTIVSYNNCIKSGKLLEIGELDEETGETEGGTFNLESQTGQCLKSDGTEEGGITIYDGELICNAKQDGIEAELDINIYGGDIQIITDVGSTGTLSDDSASSKGIKSETNITISDGTFNIDSLDDSIHSNGNITITGGTFNLATSDDGIHADDTFTLTGGTINISKSYEGIEAETLNFNGGIVNIKASDDGINAAGGSDTNKTTNPWESSSTGTLNITDGYIYIDAEGDGLDSNGNIYVTGGFTVIAGPTNGGDGALDVGDNGGYLSQSGGTLIAYGDSGMAINASQGTQKTMLFNHSSKINSSYYYIIKDSSGNIVNVIKPSKATNSLYFSTSSLTSGKYTLYTAKVSDVSISLTELFKGVYSTTDSISGTSVGSIDLTSTTNGSYGSSQGGQGGHGGNPGGPGGR